MSGRGHKIRRDLAIASFGFRQNAVNYDVTPRSPVLDSDNAVKFTVTSGSPVLDFDNAAFILLRRDFLMLHFINYIDLERKHLPFFPNTTG